MHSDVYAIYCCDLSVSLDVYNAFVGSLFLNIFFTEVFMEDRSII